MTFRRQKATHFEWIDLCQPNESDLRALAQELNTDSEVFAHSLDPHYLPICEPLGKGWFLILRVFDESIQWEDPQLNISVQGLTRKLSVYIDDKTVVTIHRSEHSYLSKGDEVLKTQSSSFGFLNKLLLKAFHSFDLPLSHLQHSLELMESRALLSARAAQRQEDLTKTYDIRSIAGVFRRALRLNGQVVITMREYGLLKRNDLRDFNDRLLNYCDELWESVHSFMNLQLAQSTQRTNDIMKALTVISAMMLPLNLITGFYGMNFVYLPFSQHPWGALVVLTSLIAIPLGIFILLRFRRII